MTDMEKLEALASAVCDDTDKASELAEAAEDLAEAGKHEQATKKMKACKAVLERALARFGSLGG